mmetsp:Transcript_7845/g.5887  ORF Transcript_7845/g.5887 Transcript_7845/m.5887 type:complete len:144 (-) Transcript_7845:50-481(-)|eukprot:CAMPEP_0202970560 /NCGR_PEP_ID=MMETSP1396-20130829/17672_1 /ASSEMBLY_ACC=CAM_ASM_000872 /TAXON_ID= /ORGANISM="Pseudokeronopsis sp., Strain Brazil" /LENGTH=143 /DNA_ID=CAMNT_0049699141 /DNA_START=37 /DNA_END=468 /DNA_ORIENTATION=+
MGIIKSGKVVILTAGRFAGRKAVVVKTSEDGNQSKKFGHALVAGIDRYPRKVTRAMGKKKAEKRTKVKPFIKIVNFSHLMPTRYSVDIDLKKAVDENSLSENNRATSRKAVKKIFEERYRNSAANKSEKKAAGTQYFFNKLRF